MKTVLELASDLNTGKTTARALAEAALEKIAEAETGGPGENAFIHVDQNKVRNTADALDRLRDAGAALSPLSGIPTAVKDLYDVKGEVTTAGSVILKGQQAAEEDAVTVSRVRQAGFTIIGRTNMTEFAYSGLGLNPHYGTPSSPWGRATKGSNENNRIPGGSSSGSGVAVADGITPVALGTDTGGSCRIPAAFCGVTGYKPTASRIPLTGITPLSPSLDSSGPIGLSVTCCAIMDAVLAGLPMSKNLDVPAGQPISRLRFAVPKAQVFDSADDSVLAAFDRAVAALKDAGAIVEEIAFDVLNEIPAVNKKGGLAAAEAYQWHKHPLSNHASLYDPRVGSRIMVGASQSADEYIDLLNARKRIIAEANSVTAGYDAVLAPTVAIIPPRYSEVDNDETYAPTNILTLRNTSFGNFLDRCAISLPCHREGEAPVGLMLMGETGADRALFETAKTVETLLTKFRGA